MLYLGRKELTAIGNDWGELIEGIAQATKLYKEEDYAQPIKPYLRYRNPSNRIIAMPAFIGGDFSMAGIKWIASFPSNTERGIPRAHSVTILNDANSGQPVSIINSTVVSEVRTAAVSGYFIREVMRLRKPKGRLKVGLTGFGPIGRIHLKMLRSVLGDRISHVNIFDLRTPDSESLQMFDGLALSIVDRWQDAYKDSDIFVTCTVSSERYINFPPKNGSLHLNVSLRDYYPEMRSAMNHIIVDDWDEVCRENTDIEKMYIDAGLKKTDTTILAEMSSLVIREEDTLMFNPMGMAIYDIAIAHHFYTSALNLKVGVFLDE